MSTAVEARVAPPRDVPSSEPVPSASHEHVSLGERLKASFTSTTFYLGLIIAGLALLLYALVGVLGSLPVSYAVFGLALGVTIAVMPGASPLARLISFLGGGGLALLSYVVRSLLLPFTPGSAAAVVFVMLLLVAVAAALTRNPTCLVAMLLGVAAVYGLSEVAFTAAPLSSLATTVATIAALPLSFALGFTVPQLFGLTLGRVEAPATEIPVASSSPEHGVEECPFCPIRYGQREDHHEIG